MGVLVTFRVGDRVLVNVGRARAVPCRVVAVHVARVAAPDGTTRDVASFDVRTENGKIHRRAADKVAHDPSRTR